MENRSELSDIVLEKGGNKTLKMKRLLILIAFLILVFLVALASMKLAHNGSQQKDNSKLVLPPEPSQETQVPKDDQLFRQVPIIEENASKKESFEEMIKALKEKEAQKQEGAKAAADDSINKDPVSTSTQAPAPTTKVKEEPKKEKEVVKPVVKQAPAPVAPTAPVSAPVSSSASSSHEAQPGIYVQVGASATAPDARQLAEIKSKGFDCKQYTTVVNGNKVVKVLVGPYASSAEAENALSLVRSSVNKNAFIYRVK